MSFGHGKNISFGIRGYPNPLCIKEEMKSEKVCPAKLQFNSNSIKSYNLFCFHYRLFREVVYQRHNHGLDNISDGNLGFNPKPQVFLTIKCFSLHPRGKILLEVFLQFIILF